MGKIKQHFHCFDCDNDQEIVMDEAKAAIYSATVRCGGCGKNMDLIDEEIIDDFDEGCDGDIPYGPLNFLDL